MLRSEERKLALSGWLKHSDLDRAYSVPLLLQKFLFFYETFCKVSGLEYDFHKLQGWPYGPVFSTVWDDYKCRREEFNSTVDKVYESGVVSIDITEAQRAAFLVSSVSQEEVSELTHKYHLWNSKAELIHKGYHVDLNELDFNDDDVQMTKMLKSMYPNDMVQNSIILSFNEIFFVISKEDIQKITEEHRGTMQKIALDPVKNDLHNPVFVSVDEGGALLVD